MSEHRLEPSRLADDDTIRRVFSEVFVEQLLEVWSGDAGDLRSDWFDADVDDGSRPVEVPREGHGQIHAQLHQPWVRFVVPARRSLGAEAPDWLELLPPDQRADVFTLCPVPFGTTQQRAQADLKSFGAMWRRFVGWLVEQMAADERASTWGSIPSVLLDGSTDPDAVISLETVDIPRPEELVAHSCRASMTRTIHLLRRPCLAWPAAADGSGLLRVTEEMPDGVTITPPDL